MAIWALAYLTETLKSKRVLAIIGFIFAISFYYFKRVASHLSFSIVVNNSDYMTHWDGWIHIFKLAYSTFFASDFFWSATFALLLYFSHSWKAPFQKTFAATKLRTGLALTLIFVVSLIQPYSMGPVTNFIRSIYHHYVPTYHRLVRKAEILQELPHIQVETHFPSKKRPHVFLILVESFNGRFINQKADNGEEYTPYFNSLTRQHLYFNNYYSNSIQTAKGHFAALCGQVPMIRGIEFKNAECFTKTCLPTLMHEHGYTTTFLQADPNYDTDNSEDFMLSRGFQEVPRISPSCSKDKARCYGIGVRDDVFYNRAFEFLNQKPKDKPIFATLATVASHMPFDHQPIEERFFYKDAHNRREHYINNLRMIDSSIAEFFRLFEKSEFAKNSIVIITGDHAFPTGEHGSFHNENYAYQENFGVPFLIYDSRQDLRKKYEELSNEVFTHLNLGPTIVDLAGINAKTHFVMPSLFAKEAKDQPAYLVQPYSGGFEAAIEWPYKYIFSEFRQQEVLYNLANDPQERQPLDIATNKPLVRKLRLHAAQIFKQQNVFKCEQNPVLDKLSKND